MEERIRNKFHGNFEAATKRVAWQKAWVSSTGRWKQNESSQSYSVRIEAILRFLQTETFLMQLFLLAWRSEANNLNNNDDIELKISKKAVKIEPKKSWEKFVLSV